MTDFSADTSGGNSFAGRENIIIDTVHPGAPSLFYRPASTNLSSPQTASDDTPTLESLDYLQGLAMSYSADHVAVHP